VKSDDIVSGYRKRTIILTRSIEVSGYYQTSKVQAQCDGELSAALESGPRQGRQVMAEQLYEIGPAARYGWSVMPAWVVVAHGVPSPLRLGTLAVG
jgi:hypothetical protein